MAQGSIKRWSEFAGAGAAAAAAALLLFGVVRAEQKNQPEEDYAPHTPTLSFYVQGLTPEGGGAISAAERKLKSVSRVTPDLIHGIVQVRFDSHVVSYHQIAQAIMAAGAGLGKKYDPALKFTVPDYAKGGNAPKVDAILKGKRLNTRVKVEAIDKAHGVFLIHFLPLKVDPSDPAPQGFNGGHLHHPISDPPPRGLGLPSSYPGE